MDARTVAYAVLGVCLLAVDVWLYRVARRPLASVSEP